MKDKRIFTIILLGILLLASQMIQVNATPLPTISIYTIADAYVDVAHPQNRYGDVQFLLIADSDNYYRIYMKFDISSLNDFTLSEAILSLTCTNPIIPINWGWSYEIYRVTEDWDEGYIAHYNAPNAEFLTDGYTDLIGNGITLEINMYTICNDYWLNGENYGVMFNSSRLDLVRFMSRETETYPGVPKLNITYSIPETENVISVLIFSAMAISIMIYKRKD